MIVTMLKSPKRSRARGFAKSVALTPEEHEQLKTFGDASDTQAVTAKKLGITRSAYLRILGEGSGRGDYIKSIKRVLQQSSEGLTDNNRLC